MIKVPVITFFYTWQFILKTIYDYVTCSIEIRNKSKMPSLAFPFQSVRRGEFGCDGQFSGFMFLISVTILDCCHDIIRL